MEKSVTGQERELKESIRRTRGNPDRTGTARRDTLKRLIDATHSPHPSIKILAAGAMRYYFSDFPELEEATINAIYDLCEDQSPKVRIEGYNAITQVSRAQVKWVKRNADVLVQLLQSDEPDEVIVVKTALIEHLDLDPRVTLGVLCDQIMPPPEDQVDEEERSIRDRLRSLVLAFLTGEAQRAIERHATPGSEAEEVLHSGLLAAIPRLGTTETNKIIKDLIFSLPAYKFQTSRGLNLLQVLLDKASQSYRLELQNSQGTSLETTFFYLDLAAYITVEKRVAPATSLLQFYCSTLVSKMALQKLGLNLQMTVIRNLAETLANCEAQTSNNNQVSQISALRRQVVDACPIIFERLLKSNATDTRSRNSCIILLNACVRRKTESDWTIPVNLSSVLARAMTSSMCSGVGSQVQQLQSLIRSLVPPASIAEVKSSKEFTSKPTPVKQSDVEGQDSTSLEQPPLHGISTRRMKIPNKRQVEEDTTTARSSSSSNIAALKSKGGMNVEHTQRPPKRLKQDGDERSSGPSLLSRLGNPTSGIQPSIAPAKTIPAAEDDMIGKIPAGGYSIKGAAKRDEDIKSDPSTYSPRLAASASLLDRLGKTGFHDDGGSGGRKTHRRGKGWSS